MYQISELKCDHFACSLGVRPDDLIGLLQRVVKRSKEKKKYTWYQEIIRRYYLFDAHPSVSYRIKRLKKYRKWSDIEYITFPFHVCWQLMSGKGWSK